MQASFRAILLQLVPLLRNGRWHAPVAPCQAVGGVLLPALVEALPDFRLTLRQECEAMAFRASRKLMGN